MNAAAKPNTGNILRLELPDKEALHKAYMPYLKQGGVFVPTPRKFKLTAEVFLLLKLPEESEQRPVAGKVAWISPGGTSGRPAGVGIQFASGDANEAVRARIDVLLAGYADKEKATNTM